MNEIKTVRDLINELLKIEDLSKVIEINGQFAILDIQEISDRVNIVTND
ncbi:MAG: hypothetical protein [Bacteriophage sp.]|nr:MAG: hypothetical protein [Bacteriophage sp.]